MLFMLSAGDQGDDHCHQGQSLGCESVPGCADLPVQGVGAVDHDHETLWPIDSQPIRFQ